MYIAFVIYVKESCLWSIDFESFKSETVGYHDTQNMDIWLVDALQNPKVALIGLLMTHH